MLLASIFLFCSIWKLIFIHAVVTTSDFNLNKCVLCNVSLARLHGFNYRARQNHLMVAIQNPVRYNFIVSNICGADILERKIYMNRGQNSAKKIKWFEQN